MVDPSQPRVDPTSVRSNWMRHAYAAHILQQVTSAFEAHGIPVLPVKGILTAHALYEDVAKRPIGDIDLRIPRRHFRQAVRIAQSRGWNQPNPESPVLWTSMRKVAGWEVDIECTLGPPGLCTLSVEDLIRRARRSIEPFGFLHLQPELNDHALILAINAFKDGLRPMPWALEDLRRIARHESFDVDLVVQRAREGRIASALWIVAEWLVEMHRAAEWRVVRDRIGSHPPSARVAEAYAYVQRRGWPPKPGLLATAASGDNLLGCTSGLALAVAGIVRGRCVRALHGVSDRSSRNRHRERCAKTKAAK
jgi:hypothetical protein